MYGEFWRWLGVALFCCTLLWSEAALAITTAPYYPLQPGNSWTYENSVSGTYSATIQSSPVVVNSVITYVLQDSDGLLSYLSNDQNGIRLHRQYDPAVWIEGLGYRSLDVTYSPPMKMANAEAYIGESLYSTGTAATTVSGLETFNLTYEMTSTIETLEGLTVSAGSYQAVKISQVLHIYGNVLGTYQSDTLNSISWFAKDIGQVKYLELSATGNEEDVLVSTNVAPKVTLLIGPNGSIVPSTPQYVPVNESIVFEILPDPNYTIENITGCGGSLEGNRYTTAPITSDCTVSATFYLLEYSPSIGFVRQVYLDFLNREADLNGLSYWVTELDAGNITHAAMVEQFMLSAEFGEKVAPVTRLYFAYFLRIPDYGGLMYWVNEYASGNRTLNNISNFFAGSPEFQATYGSLDNGQFVDLIYSNLFNRTADADGRAYWVGELEAGNRTRGEVMLFFSDSEEYRTLMANPIYVTMTYIGLLRRAPEQGGFDYWVSRRDQGDSGQTLIDLFLNSQEYAARFP